MVRIRRWLAIALVACSHVLIPVTPSEASWDYAYDSLADGSGAAYGFNYGGIAFLQTGNTGYFAILSGAPRSGVTMGSSVLNNTIGHGDLFLNFSGHGLNSAASYTDPDVFAVRFDQLNDSFHNAPGQVNHETGLYSDVSALSLTTSNLGYQSLEQYMSYGYMPSASTNAMADLGTRTDVLNYLGNGQPGNTKIYPNIASGTKLADISIVEDMNSRFSDGMSLSSLGLNFQNLTAQDLGYTPTIFGFSIDLSQLGLASGFHDFTASLFFECGNDGIALRGNVDGTEATNFSPVPEPSSIALLGIGALGALTGSIRRRRTHVS